MGSHRRRDLEPEARGRRPLRILRVRCSPKHARDQIMINPTGPRFDYVVVDSATGAVDNNKARDYALQLEGGPTEQEVLESRAAAYEQVGGAGRGAQSAPSPFQGGRIACRLRLAFLGERGRACRADALGAFPQPRLSRTGWSAGRNATPPYRQAEAERRAMLAAEEERLWALVDEVAREAAEKARVEFRWAGRGEDVVLQCGLGALPFCVLCTCVAWVWACACGCGVQHARGPHSGEWGRRNRPRSDRPHPSPPPQTRARHEKGAPRARAAGGS
jgi:hypothetical protein